MNSESEIRSDHSDCTCFAAVFRKKPLLGLIGFLEKELISLGGMQVEQAKRGVEFQADMATLFRVCLCSRFALTVLRPVLTFDAQNPDALYDEAKRWDWGAIMTAQSSFAIDVTVHSGVFTHSQFAMLRLKDGRCRSFSRIFGTSTGASTEKILISGFTSTLRIQPSPFRWMRRADHSVDAATGLQEQKHH